MSKNSGRSVIAVRCGARWVTSMPHARARSIWARSSRCTSSGSACSHRSSIVRGKPPSPDSSDGACVIGPHRYVRCSALSVRWTPMSSPGRTAFGRVRGPTAPAPSATRTWRRRRGVPSVHADVGGVARPEVVAGQDHQTGVGSVPEAFGERSSGHGGDAIRRMPPTARVPPARRRRRPPRIWSR